MALEHPRLLAASLTAAVLGTSCSTSTEMAPPADPNAGNASSPEAQQPMSAQDPMQNLDEERRRAWVQNLLQNAQELRARGDLKAAKFELLKAKEIAPANEDVRTLLASVQAELGEPAGRIVTFHDEQVRLQQIREERARAAVETQLQKAQQAVAEKNFAGAVDELRRASLAIELTSDIDWMSLPQQVGEAKREAERLLDEQQQRVQAEQNAQLAEQLRRENARIQAEKRARVDGLIQQAQIAFEARQFEHSRDLAQRAIEIEPHNSLAYEMLNAATKAARETANEDYWRTRALAIRKMLEAEEDLKVPQTDILVMNTETWARAQGRAARRMGATAVEPQDALLMEQVNTIQVGRLNYTEETGDYLEVVKNLSLITGVQIITTPEARQIISSEGLKVVIELVSSMNLRDFLNHMVGRTESLAWTVKNGVIVIGNKSQAAGTILTEVYPVKDLLFKQTRFLPPTIRDIPTEDFADVPRTGGEGDDPVGGIELSELVDTLQQATDPTYWSTDGVELRAEDSGLLTVKASPEMHAKLLKVLGDMRRFQTPMVTVDSKFLTISRNFLQEIGIDIRGLGGAGNKGTGVSLDDVTNGLVSNASRGLDNGGTGDPAANPTAGAFFNDGGDGDVRARTENYFTSDLGRALSPTGGLTAGWTLIDDTQLNMILRAVEKRQDGEVVNSKILSVVNRGHGHVAVINQTAYVRDFDVEVAQQAFIADPKIDVIQDGIVLDVQPIILNDRKYIILNLNPTVAELTRPIPTFTTSLAGSTLPVTVQLPNLTVTNFSTTVKVPDGGTVLLGGLRQVLTKERRAEVPLLARLPLIGFLFRQEGSVDENRSLMVMVRAQITDVVDQFPPRGRN
jgi:type II secretory pathway component GspD/PulD (secretin)